MKHTLEDVPRLVDEAFKAALENDQLQFLQTDADGIADDMLSADADIEALQETYNYEVLHPLIAAHVRKIQNDL